MTRELLINVGVGEIRIAGTREGKLVRYSVERTLDEDERTSSSLVGNIVLGRVEKLMPALDAAFVAIGLERSGFLGGREAQGLGGGPINQCVREGQIVLLQIAKDPIADKGARLTADISLAGRFCVLTPNRPGIFISRRIEDDAERARLLAVCDGLAPEGMGLILRTASVGIAREAFAADIAALHEQWQDISAARAQARPPATLYRELGPIARALRDTVHADTSRIVIDDAQSLTEARHYCRRAMPDADGRLQLFSGPGGVLDEYEDDIERLQNMRIGLPSGGWITIETTEALTAIDVNSGSFAQSAGRAETALAVNLEAAAEIGRQLVLRSIGGLIVTDFIHVDSEQHRSRIVAALQAALSEGTQSSHISPMSSLGLVAITRRRESEPLAQRVSVPCLCCSGKGRMPAEGTMAMAALRRAEGEARANPGRMLVIRAAPSVVGWIEAHRAAIMPRLVQRGVSRLSTESEPQFSREVFDVRAI